MKSYVKPNIVGDFLDIETCNSIGNIVLLYVQLYIRENDFHAFSASKSILRENKENYGSILGNEENDN